MWTRPRYNLEAWVSMAHPTILMSIVIGKMLRPEHNHRSILRSLRELPCRQLQSRNKDRPCHNFLRYRRPRDRRLAYPLHLKSHPLINMDLQALLQLTVPLFLKATTTANTQIVTLSLRRPPPKLIAHLQSLSPTSRSDSNCSIRSSTIPSAGNMEELV